MLDYETFCQIRDQLTRQQLSQAQTARALGLDVRTVAKWANVEQFHSRKGVARVGKLDAFKGQIVRWLDTHPTPHRPRTHESEHARSGWSQTGG